MAMIGLMGDAPVLRVTSAQGYGSAAFVEGLGLVSATHVLEGHEGHIITLDGVHHPVKILQQKNDIALLEGSGPTALKLGPCPQRFDQVAILGSVPPFRVFGYVDKIFTEASVAGRITQGFTIQATIPQGFSGGPVVDQHQRILGITSGTWLAQREAFIGSLAPLTGAKVCS